MREVRGMEEVTSSSKRYPFRKMNTKMMMMCVLCLFVCMISFLGNVEAVDRNKFHTCEQTYFCRANRAPQEKQFLNDPRYQLIASSIQLDEQKHCVTGEVAHLIFKPRLPLKFSLCLLPTGIVHVYIDEISPLFPRWRVPDVIRPSATALWDSEVFGSLQMTKSDSSVQLTWSQSENPLEFSTTKVNFKINILLNPLKILLLKDDVLIATWNARNLLSFEPYRHRNPLPEGQDAATANAALDLNTVGFPYDDPAMWEEHISGHADRKERGPASVGGDITFHNFTSVYGLPEHASPFSLRSTRSQSEGDFREPYRLFNLDVFEYEINEPMALYGAVPYVIAHAPHASVGMLWLNSAETFVDVIDVAESTKDKNVHFLSESGVVDAFIIVGPTPAALHYQYAELTGYSALPPKFSIGYHQCRWNYKSQEDLLSVEASFDENDIPMDVIWLDIEHTDGKKYFTWDRSNFPNPIEMQNALISKSRKLVTIVDPHIKRDSNYIVHTQALENDYYVKTSTGNVYEGWCWPGSVSYLDFLDETVRDYWASKFALTSYPESTHALYIWNDMNEPSVFNGPEVSMPRDCKHLHGTVEHRDAHNLFGFYNQWATSMGLQRRDQARSFVLSRSFFAGSQRFGAIWTGDNKADWSHLKAAVPMLLSMSVSGIVFSGSDVGGFFGNPDPEMLIRWYQMAAFHPFFRAHAHIDAKRREPWLFGDENTNIIRNAIRSRYSHLPYLYTAFFQSSVTGLPIMRPLWLEFPSDTDFLTEEVSFMIGASIMVHPIVEPSVTSVQFRLPEGVWFNVDTLSPYAGKQTVNVPVTIDAIPKFYRGGSVVVKRERARRSSPLMDRDPFTLYVVLNTDGNASGEVYLDDGASFSYQSGHYLYRQFTFTENTLRSTILDLPAASTKSNHNFVAAKSPSSNDAYTNELSTIERIVLVGLPSSLHYTSATLQSANQENISLTLVKDSHRENVLIVRKPDMLIRDDFIIEFA